MAAMARPNPPGEGENGEKIGEESVTKVETEDGNELAKEDEKFELFCSICFTGFEEEIERGVLNCCDHFFCFSCIMTWSKVDSKCPLCSRRFDRVKRMGGLRSERPEYYKIPTKDQKYQPSEEENEAILEPYALTVCLECGEERDESVLLLCDSCDGAYHTYCVGLGSTVPSGNWFCSTCKKSNFHLRILNSCEPEADFVYNESGTSESDSDSWSRELDYGFFREPSDDDDDGFQGESHSRSGGMRNHTTSRKKRKWTTSQGSTSHANRNRLPRKRLRNSFGFKSGSCLIAGDSHQLTSDGVVFQRNVRKRSDRLTQSHNTRRRITSVQKFWDLMEKNETRKHYECKETNESGKKIACGGSSSIPAEVNSSGVGFSKNISNEIKNQNTNGKRNIGDIKASIKGSFSTLAESSSKKSLDVERAWTMFENAKILLDKERPSKSSSLTSNSNPLTSSEHVYQGIHLDKSSLLANYPSKQNFLQNRDCIGLMMNKSKSVDLCGGNGTHSKMKREELLSSPKCDAGGYIENCKKKWNTGELSTFSGNTLSQAGFQVNQNGVGLKNKNSIPVHSLKETTESKTGNPHAKIMENEAMEPQSQICLQERSVRGESKKKGDLKIEAENKEQNGEDDKIKTIKCEQMYDKNVVKNQVVCYSKGGYDQKDELKERSRFKKKVMDNVSLLVRKELNSMYPYDKSKDREEYKRIARYATHSICSSFGLESSSKDRQISFLKDKCTHKSRDFTICSTCTKLHLSKAMDYVAQTQENSNMQATKNLNSKNLSLEEDVS